MSEKERSNDEKTKNEAEIRENTRQLELKTLASETLKNLIIASAGKNTEFYGNMGKVATQSNYLHALSNPDEYLSRVLAEPYLQSAEHSQKNKVDIYENGVSASPAILFKNAAEYYTSSLTKVKVSDVLGLIGIKEVNEANISAEDKNMYMEDYFKKNEKMSGELVQRFLGSVQNKGVAEAIMNHDVAQTKGLEGKLMEAPKKKEEGNNKQ